MRILSVKLLRRPEDEPARPIQAVHRPASRSYGEPSQTRPAGRAATRESSGLHFWNAGA